MTDLYLIAHKVRGEPAFDVAAQFPCTECQGYESVTGAWCEPTKPQAECDACDGEGYTWIIPTSGHRAFPYAWQPFHAMDLGPGFEIEIPPGLPDHYPHSASPSKPKLDIAALLAPAPVKIQRRF